MTLLWTFSVAFSNYQLFKDSLFSHKIVSYPRSSPSTYPNKPVCVITGATSGLGLSTACKLSKEGYVVVIVGRSEQLLSEADLSSVESIIKFSTSLRQWLLDSDLHCSVQILINNAGILATSLRVTAEGYDQMIGTNYIGPFVMTKLLLPLLESSHVSSKIVNVTSFTHRAVTNMQVDEGTVYGKKFLKSKQYPYAQIYEYSKLCLLLFSYELHRQLCQMGKSHQIFVNVANPRVVQTNIMREVPASLSWVAFFVLKRLRLLESSECGNDSIIDAALVPPGTSGAYFFWGKGRTINSSALSQDAKLAHELWETTSNLLSVTPFGN
ncbi:rossmann-fold NAD(P)-binding domain protein [Medicago truncatula]|uniref:Rossmann-fold NAD(P)-binding domain protein n=1 Tax=Medicago truncatula TaxID=3880 RepID=G7J6T2_MEDTR|nr:rossmann-fold NAD(P)-binding domain protein [Medicago truncatula]